MAKVKFDVSGDIPETINAPVGTYRGKIKDAEARDSNAGNPMVVITWELTHHADGKKVTDDYWPVRTYLMVADERPYAKRTIKQFVTALGLKLKGEMDLNKLIGKTAQLKLKSDTDQDGEYQPRIGQIMPASSKADADEPEPEQEPDAEPEPEDEEGEAIDLDSLDRSELKKLIKEEELGSLADLGITKATTDDEIRTIIAEAMGGDEEEEEPEPEDEPEPEPEDDDAEPEGDDEEEGDGYDDMAVADLKAELKERELPTNGAKKVLIARLRKDDQEEPF